MASVDLVFRQAPVSQPADLLFGEVENLPDVEVKLAASMPGLQAAINIKPLVDVSVAATMPGLQAALLLVPPAEVEITATMPALQALVAIAPVVDITVTGTMPGLQVAIEARYISGAARPLTAQAETGFQKAVGTDAGAGQGWQQGEPTPSGVTSAAQQAVPTPSGTNTGWTETQRRRTGTATGYENAVRAHSEVASAYQNMLRGIRPALDGSWQVADGRRSSARTDWQERFRDRRPSVMTSWGLTRRLLHQLSESAQNAVPLVKKYGSRYQEAIVPPPGMYKPPVPPVKEPCYTPPLGHAVHLLFASPPGDGNLVFVCEKGGGVTPPGETVVVPVKRVYMVINNTSLLKVNGSTLTALPTYDMSLNIDVDSWTWGFSASLPVEALADLQPVGGMPVELEASINGTAYRVLAEKITRDRSFARQAIRVTGRGKSALLAAPYAPIQNFSNDNDRTAQQLMADALTLNGAPIGWDIDWQIEDWLVPAGAWNKQGVYIDALGAIAGAAGAYLQPHPTDQVMQVLSRYPFAPWEWATEITPDFELPAAVTTNEGIEWLDKPGYNRVFVSGVSAGVTAQVTRTGTDGSLLAPMTTDALITDEVVARQRGRVILSDTGRQALVKLRLPVLEETGVITPGKFVRYVDGSDIKLGVVRGTGVEAAGKPDVWQTISVETHVEA